MFRSRLKLNYGASRNFGVGPKFGATRKQPIIPGNSWARSCAGEEDRVTWLDLQPALPGQSPEALTAENGCFQRSEVASGPPIHPCWLRFLQIRGHSTSSQLKIYFFHESSKHFAINTIALFMKKQLIWVFEWRKSVHYWWSYKLFSPEC